MHMIFSLTDEKATVPNFANVLAEYKYLELATSRYALSMLTVGLYVLDMSKLINIC